MISAVVDTGISYPAPDESYSPDERYPEYPFARLARKPNPVYRTVRQLLHQLGLDDDHYGTPDWNPLGRWILPGQSVFVLCNFVYHRRPGESLERFYSKCTHGSVIRAVVDYVLIAVGPTGHVRFGNAPLQSCAWSRVLRDTGADRVDAFYASTNSPARCVDLRLFVNERPGRPFAARLQRRGDDAGVTIDLAHRSLLAALDDRQPHYRVSDYDPRRTEAFHRAGSHQYVLHRDVLGSDVVVSIPKLKTHEKVGLTCALKGCVGAIGHKDCLAHHRLGAPRRGGDEYRADPLGLLRCFSLLHDRVHSTRPDAVSGRAMRGLFRALRAAVRRVEPTINGAWSGNDTCWRTAVDIARLVAHARPDGTIAPEIIRPHVAFLDGVLGGEGDGPLNPTPVHSGALMFASDPVELDQGAARLIGCDPQGLAIVREAGRLADLPLYDAQACEGPASTGSLCGQSLLVTLNGRQVPLEQLSACTARRYRLPKGWR